MDMHDHTPPDPAPAARRITRTEYVTIEYAANEIARAANIVYWIGRDDDAVMRLKTRVMHEQFARLAEMMGYRIEPAADMAEMA